MKIHSRLKIEIMNYNYRNDNNNENGIKIDNKNNNNENNNKRIIINKNPYLLQQNKDTNNKIIDTTRQNLI